ncbi:hypothetical protein CDD83_11079 [Cordyceps sp. RAO-2017]|nr:hypothetical protein CDD83_11079 [Cordyceps sp. RAO-2017]
MPVKHIVMMKFKDGTSADAIKQVCAEMLGLKEACVHPATAAPYIRASAGGRDNSIEGLQNGLTHVFVVDFASVADRDYYVKQDAAHAAFVARHLTAPGAAVERAMVLDFEPGVFDA